ncbi:MAG: ABC transporter substrate-binding protein [Dehalococcoidales bacterium]|nr:ABC transporter substrate-binding protein [Dehalococcoidales bacterium]
MRRKIIWLVASSLMVLALLASACAPAAEEAVPSAPTPAAKTPAAKEESKPAAKETATPTEGKDMIKVSLTKLDGSTVERELEKPQYGGEFVVSRSSGILAWDEAVQAPWSLGSNLGPTNEDLIVGDWARGAAGTDEIDWSFGEWTSMAFASGQLAESWEITDPDTIVFHIRKGVHWHSKTPVNGREFTADDVVFNLKRIYIDTPSSTMYGMVGDARPTEVYAEDKYTVVVKAPAGTIGNTMEEIGNLTKMFPPEVIEKFGDHNAWENVVGTGPFTLSDYVPMSSVTYLKNPNYWKHDPVLGPDFPLPYVDVHKVLIIPDRSTDQAALRTGKIDYSPNRWPREEARPLLDHREDLKSYRYTPYVCYPLGFRVDKPDLPFYDIRVRRALLMGIDDQAISDDFFEGDAAVLNYKVAPAPPYIKAGWYTPLEDLPPAEDGFDTRKLFGYHPEEAKELLAEAGYPNGFKTEAVLRGVYPYIDYAQMAQFYWEKIGVDLTLDVKETGTFYSIYQRKTHNEMLFCGRAYNVRSMYLCRKGNMYNWSMIDDPRIDEYFNGIAGAFFDDPTRDKLVREMNQYVLSQAWYWAPPSPYSYRVWQPWLKNFRGESSLGVYSGTNWQEYVWIDEDLKESLGY